MPKLDPDDLSHLTNNASVGVGIFCAEPKSARRIDLELLGLWVNCVVKGMFHSDDVFNFRNCYGPRLRDLLRSFRFGWR